MKKNKPNKLESTWAINIYNTTWGEKARNGSYCDARISNPRMRNQESNQTFGSFCLVGYYYYNRQYSFIFVFIWVTQLPFFSTIIPFAFIHDGTLIWVLLYYNGLAWSGVTDKTLYLYSISSHALSDANLDLLNLIRRLAAVRKARYDIIQLKVFSH